MPFKRAASKIVVPVGTETLAAVDRQLDLSATAVVLIAEPRCVKQTPAGQRRPECAPRPLRRKCFSTDAMGTGTNWPRPQMEVSFMRLREFVDQLQVAVLAVALRSSRSACPPSSASPTRQGTHLPQDSLRKKRTALSAMSSMQRPSAQTTMAPEPSMEPAAASDLKSSGRSTMRRRQIA